MNNKILTISIPTHNRIHHLKNLVDIIALDCEPFINNIDIYISDNFSTDNTRQYLLEMSEKYDFIKFNTNFENFGPDKNFQLCFQNCKTKYFWMMGDDDLPKVNSIQLILNLLKDREPDAMYVSSQWAQDIVDLRPNLPIHALSLLELNREDFARSVNVWLGYCSGLIINKNCITLDEQDKLSALNGTSLLQLGWALPALANGKKFIFIRSKAILATKANTGGYAGIQVFGINFPKILASYLGDNVRLQELIISRMMFNFYCALVWKIRHVKNGTFLTGGSLSDLRTVLGAYWAFWIFIVPIYKLPKYIGLFFVLIAKSIALFQKKLVDRV